jgi:hypothetical protein
MNTRHNTAGSSSARNRVYPIFIELLEERTLLSATVDAEDGSAAVSTRSGAAAQTAKQDDEAEETPEREDAAAAPQQEAQQNGSPRENNSGGSSETEIEDVPAAPTPQSERDSSSAVDQVLTQTAVPPQSGAWRTGLPVDDVTNLVGNEVLIAAADASAFAGAAAVAASKLVVSAPRVALRAFSTSPLIGMAQAGAGAVQQIPVVAQAMAMLPIDVSSPHSSSVIPGQKRTYRFARLGNPMSLLADAMGAFTEESARGPARVKFALTRPSAWAITIAVLMVDCLALVYYRARQRHRDRAA